MISLAGNEPTLPSDTILPQNVMLDYSYARNIDSRVLLDFDTTHFTIG
jgi:hypothetical protein